MKRITAILFFFVLLIAGFLWRYYLYTLNPQYLIYDQYQYYGYALSMLVNGLAGDTVRLYGYPLLIIPIIKYFGVSSPIPWVVFHSILEMFTAIMVFDIAKKIFSQDGKWIPWVSYILYLFNPYTSAYTSVLLTEIATIHLVTLALWLTITYLYNHKDRLLILAAFILGYIPQIRPSFFYWSIIMICVIVWLRIRTHVAWKKKLITSASIIILSLLPFSYTVISNVINYHQFALQSVDNIFWREVYISNFIGRGIPFSGNPEWIWPQEAYDAWYEYSTPTTPEGRVKMAEKYKEKSMAIMKADFPTFLIHHMFKLWYVWEKHFLYPYQIGPDSPIIRFFVYWGNVWFVCIGWIGACIYTIKQKHHTGFERTLIGVISLGLLVYITIAHVFSTSEERFSLPAYPMIAVFGGYMVTKLMQLLASSLHKRHNGQQ